MYSKLDLSKIENKAKLMGMECNNLSDSGLVVHANDKEDILYIPSRNKPLKISKELCIPEYLGINGIVIVRYVKKTICDYCKSMIKLYFPYTDRTMTFEEIAYLSPYSFSGGKLPNTKISALSSFDCGAILLKIRPSENGFGELRERTFVINNHGYRKQISNRYVCVANAGWDENYNRKYVLLQIGRNATPFENVDKLHKVDKIYLDNNFINSNFTKYRLLSPSDRVLTKE